MKHPGFKRVAEQAEERYESKGMSEGEAQRRAYGGIANAARNASAAAKRKNPRLKRVKAKRRK